ncbi:transposase [Streptomyces sp. NPDC054841]
MGCGATRTSPTGYPRDGRAGLSPAQLATVCVLQFLLGLSDRQAAEAVRCRIDFKYAMAMELDDPGFHHSVLADFRDRLAEDDRIGRPLSRHTPPARHRQRTIPGPQPTLRNSDTPVRDVMSQTPDPGQHPPILPPVTAFPPGNREHAQSQPLGRRGTDTGRSFATDSQQVAEQ